MVAVNKIVIHTVMVRGLIEDLHRATSLIDVVTQYLHSTYENKEQVMTPFQLASMLELVDSALMEKCESFSELLAGID